MQRDTLIYLKDLFHISKTWLINFNTTGLTWCACGCMWGKACSGLVRTENGLLIMVRLIGGVPGELLTPILLEAVNW